MIHYLEVSIGKYLKTLISIQFLQVSPLIQISLRQFNKQKFREVDLAGDNIGLADLFRRNYNFNLQYVINYNLTKALKS